VTGIITGNEIAKLKIRRPARAAQRSENFRRLFTSCVAGWCGPSNLKFNHPKKFVKWNFKNLFTKKYLNLKRNFHNQCQKRMKI